MFPVYLKEVGASAFEDCEHLRNVQLNESLEKLGQKEIVNDTEYEGNVFANCAIEDIKIPFSLKRVEARTCKDCKHLANIELQNGVDYLGDKCFQSCAIEQITLPHTLKKVEESAFGHCDKLRVI